ncbi:hypothetical protein D3C80_1865650 [compost metagenome]
MPVSVARSATQVPLLVAVAAFKMRFVACSQPAPVYCGVVSVKRAPDNSLPSFRAWLVAVTLVSPPPCISP